MHPKTKRLLNVIVFAFVVIGFAVSLNLFRRVIGVSSPWFVLIVMAAFLGLVRIASPFYLLRLPRTLGKLRPREVSGNIRPVLGVSSFGQLLRRTPLLHLNPVVYLNQHPGDLNAVQRRVESAEAAHLWAAVLVTPYVVYACTQKWWSVVAWFLVIQVIVNVYPILHLRLVRGRLQRFLEKAAAKKVSLSSPNALKPNQLSHPTPTDGRG